MDPLPAKEANLGTAALATKEEDITKDDLQAMKDMIGDIKKDPSLLYRLSSLPGGNNANAAAANAAAPSSRNGSTSGKIFVDDDATDVSSLGMMSSSDYNPNSGGYFGVGGAVDAASPRSHIRHGNQLSSSAAFAQATAQTATAVRRTNHDAEIALRMQSLRAKRGFSQPSRSQQPQYSHSPLKNNTPSASSGSSPSAGAMVSTPVAPPIASSLSGNMGAASNGCNEKNTSIKNFETKGAIDSERKSDPPLLTASPSLPSNEQQHRSSPEQKSRKNHSEGRRATGDSDSVQSSSSHRSHRFQHQDTTTTQSADEEDSVALVLYNQEENNDTPHSKILNSNNDPKQRNNNQQNQVLTVSSRRGEGGYTNYSMGDDTPTRQASSSAPNYHSAVSKYAVDDKRSTSRNSRNIGGGQQQQQPGSDNNRRRSALSSVSGSSRSLREGSKSNRSRRASQSSEYSRGASATSKSAKRSQRSRSELPRQPSEGDISKRKKDRSRGTSEQPNGVRHDGYQRVHNKQNGRTNNKSLDEKNASSSRRRRHRRGDDPPSLQDQQQAKEKKKQHQHSNNLDNSMTSNASIPLDTASLLESLRADQQQQASSMRNRSKQEETISSIMDEWAAAKHEEIRSTVAVPQDDLDENTQLSHHKKIHGEQDASTTNNRERLDKVGSLPGSSSGTSYEASMENHMQPSGHYHKESAIPVDPATAAVSAPAETSQMISLGHGLAQLDQRQRKNSSEGPTPPRAPRRPSLESESGRSVISRLRRMKNRTPSKRSVSSGDFTRPSAGSLSYHSNGCDSSPMKPSGSDDSGDNKDYQHSTSFHKGLVSRISHTIGGTSPLVTSRRRLASADSDYVESVTAASSDAPDLKISKTERTSHSLYDPIAKSESDHITMGFQLAMEGGEVPRLCDERGRCMIHPHMRLQKPKLFGGWKIIFQHCPDCAVEHMKKTQEKLIEMKEQKQKEKREREQQKERERQLLKEQKRKKKREKESREKEKEKRKETADPFIGKNVGDEHFTVQNNKLSKKKRDRKKEKERLREELRATLKKDAPSNDTKAADATAMTVAAQNHDRDNQQQQPLDLKENESNNELLTQQQQPQPQQQQREKTIDQHQIEPTTILDPSQDPSVLAIVPHTTKKPKRVNGLPWSDYNGHSGRYTGEVNEQYLPHGRGEMVYDRGSISSGIWYNGVLDTEEDGNGRNGRRESGKSLVSQEEYTPDSIPNYSIGDKGQPTDMIIANKKETAASVAQIRVHDAAFVRRSDGSWTYAIVKDRTYDDNGEGTIRFKVNLRGSTKAFPTSQWGTYVRRIRRRMDAPADAPGSSGTSLGDFLDRNSGRSNIIGTSNSVAGGMRRDSGSDISVGSAHSAPMMNRSSGQNLTTGKMNIRTRSRSRSRNRKNVTTLPLLFSSAMSVSEENDEGQNNDDWETASGSGYRLRGIDP